MWRRVRSAWFHWILRRNTPEEEAVVSMLGAVSMLSTLSLLVRRPEVVSRMTDEASSALRFLLGGPERELKRRGDDGAA